MKKKKRLSGIERRWFVNNVGVIMLLVAACVLGVVFSMAAYYDTNLRSGLENKAKTTTDFFSNYISQSYKEYYQSCIKFAQTFEEKDRLELQFISANGKLVASSYGKFAGRSPSTPEIQQAIDSQQIRHYKGRNPLTGERILAVSSPMIYTNGEVIGVLRYVTSLRNADLQILMIALIAVTIGLLFIGSIFFLSSFFIKSILVPVSQINATARRIAAGSYGVQIPGQYDDEIGELAASFNNMADSLAETERQRSDFIANISHELKTPMTTIGGYIDGMLDGTIPPEKQQHYMQIVSGEVRRLSRLVRNMLDIAKLQAMGVEESRKTRFDLGEELSDVLITFEQKIYNKHLDVRVDLPDKPVWTRAERDSITQVIYNLIDNAIKFCPDGGRLALRVQVDGGKARVSVENTGPTIDKDELPLLFDRFHKADKSRSADREGWGLGLYIAKTIVGAHGGDIWATSENGVTQFNFTLPTVR